MFDWIAGFVAYWSGRVAPAILDLVHQTVHAVAGWLLGIIHDVQNSFSFYIGIINWIINQVESIARDIGNWIDYLFRTVLPWIYGRLDAAFQNIIDWVNWLVGYIKGGLDSLEHWAWSWIQYVLSWAYDNIWLPLKRYADAIWNQLVQWGYTAWWWITHPDQLAMALLGYLVGAAEAAFWTIAAPVGTFALRVVIANTQRFVALLETILTAVL